MQSEPRRPQIIHGDTPPKAKQREECPHIGGHVVKRAPKVAIPSCGPAGPACLPEALFYPAKGWALLGRLLT
jgi:hypothetical protein